jgi:hypothetical protein
MDRIELSSRDPKSRACPSSYTPMVWVIRVERISLVLQTSAITVLAQPTNCSEANRLGHNAVLKFRGVSQRISHLYQVTLTRPQKIRPQT